MMLKMASTLRVARTHKTVFAPYLLLRNNSYFRGISEEEPCGLINIHSVASGLGQWAFVSKLAPISRDKHLRIFREPYVKPFQVC